jgi:hypothetical protein
LACWRRWRCSSLERPAPKSGFLRFLSDVHIQQDGALLVEETIRVRSEGDSIQRGIFRDFPTRYRTGAGREVRVVFEVQGVERDGNPEPWTTESLSNGVRVRIGDADVLLPNGEHEYRIRYRTTRQLAYFADFDELYWNVTGTGWKFPIDVAEARVRLPSPSPFGQRSVYTGPEGAAAKDATVIGEEPGEIRFRTTSPLGPDEGLTVAIAWPKGVVAEPTSEARLGWWLQDNGPPAVGLFGLLGVLAYYFYAWRRAGAGRMPVRWFRSSPLRKVCPPPPSATSRRWASTTAPSRPPWSTAGFEARSGCGRRKAASSPRAR